jgi:hypothetical protein
MNKAAIQAYYKVGFVVELEDAGALKMHTEKTGGGAERLAKVPS